MDVEAGSSLQVDPDVSIEVIPTDPLPTVSEGGSPQRTLVLRIVHGETSILVAPSLTAEAGRSLARQGWSLRSDVLIVPRHGAASGIDPALVALIQPRVAVISVGAGNRQDLPARDTLDALRDVILLRTDINGTVELRSDGHTLSARPERAAPG